MLINFFLIFFKSYEHYLSIEKVCTQTRPHLSAHEAIFRALPVLAELVVWFSMWFFRAVCMAILKWDIIYSSPRSVSSVPFSATEPVKNEITAPQPQEPLAGGPLYHSIVVDGVDFRWSIFKL